MLIDTPTRESSPFSRVAFNLLLNQRKVESDGTLGDPQDRGDFTAGFAIDRPFHDFGFSRGQQVGDVRWIDGMLVTCPRGGCGEIGGFKVWRQKFTHFEKFLLVGRSIITEGHIEPEGVSMAADDGETVFNSELVFNRVDYGAILLRVVFAGGVLGAGFFEGYEGWFCGKSGGDIFFGEG